MLTFITGQPGAGKTLFAVSEVDKKSKAEGRAVYYNGSQLKGVTLENWHDIGPGYDWANCPEGALILLDEAHRELFPMRKVGDKVPAHVDSMSTHRHRGHDVYITAQHSTQVDTFIRKMAGEHHHLVRRFGTNNSTRFTWMEHANERDTWERKKADTSVFRYPKDYFGTYTSTVLNTVKPKLPWKRIALLVLGALSIPALLYAGFLAVAPDEEGKAAGPVAQLADGEPVRMGEGVGEPLLHRPALYSPETWQPEVREIPYSAAIYDELVRPVSFPKVSGCMQIDFANRPDICECYSQQGTQLDMSVSTCQAVIERGWFDFAKEDEPIEYPPAEPNDGPPVIESGWGTAARGASGARPAAADGQLR